MVYVCAVDSVWSVVLKRLLRLRTGHSKESTYEGGPQPWFVGARRVIGEGCEKKGGYGAAEK